MKELNKRQLSQIVLYGFKSIAECKLELGSLNILIGGNGAGKSNFVGFFQMIQHILERNLQTYISKQGGPDSVLHFGRKVTESLRAELYFGENRYKIILEPTQDNRMMFSRESLWWEKTGYRDISTGHFEAEVDTPRDHTLIKDYVLRAMKSWRVYHFHDTSDSALIKQPHGINDNKYLRPDARNLAAFMYLLKKRNVDAYNRIVKTIQLVAPFFGDFHLRPSPENQDMIELEWVEKGHDIPFKAHHLSDGTLRFICIVTVFLQPASLQPETILIDEPELGLHPYAISVLGSLIRSVAKNKQVIVSTQSVELLNEFDPEDVIVVDLKQGRSVLKRLDPQNLEEWLEEYTLGELWKKNLFGGRPTS